MDQNRSEPIRIGPKNDQIYLYREYLYWRWQVQADFESNQITLAGSFFEPDPN